MPCRGMLELPRVLWTVFCMSRDLVQTVEKIWTKNIFSSRRKNVLKIFFAIFGFQNFQKKWNFWKSEFWKIFFKTFFCRDEKIFLVQIFFYCLDYVSRLPKNCSEHSGTPKHASAGDCVSRLSLKMVGNQRTLVENHALWAIQLQHFHEK